MLAKFPKGEADTGEKLDQLIQYANKRWINLDTLMTKAKDQEKWYAAVKQAANQGRAGDLDLIYDLYQAKGGKFLGIPRGVPPRGAVPPGQVPQGAPPPLPPPIAPPGIPKAPILPAAGKPVQPPLAVPPGERGRELPKAAPKIPPPAPKPPLPPAIPPAPPPPGRRPPPKPPRREGLDDFRAGHVDTVNGSTNGANIIESMRLSEAKNLIQEIADEIKTPSEVALDLGDEGGGPDLETADLPPSEPPISDDAVGADTEGNVVLQLLSDIRDLLGELVHGGEIEGELEGELPGGELPPGEFPPEGEGGDIAADAIPEPDEEEAEEEEEYTPKRPRDSDED